MHNPGFLTAALALLVVSSTAIAGGSHHHHHDEHKEEQHSTRISPEIARASGIQTRTVARQALASGPQFFARLMVPTNQQMAIRARFPGLVTKVLVNSGDVVKRNDVLAQVESNESLRGYDIHAPFSGTVLARHVNPGSIADQQPLFELINTDTLWADIRLFGDQQHAVEIGQTVRFSARSQPSEPALDGRIRHILSAPQQPYSLARVVIDNRAGRYSPGDWLQAHILTESHAQVIAVDARAVQQRDGQSVVFVVHDDAYDSRPVVIGQSDGQWTEIVQGLNEGERYVAQGSYLIKADLEKSGASHDH